VIGAPHFTAWSSIVDNVLKGLRLPFPCVRRFFLPCSFFLEGRFRNVFFRRHYFSPKILVTPSCLPNFSLCSPLLRILPRRNCFPPLAWSLFPVVFKSPELFLVPLFFQSSCIFAILFFPVLFGLWYDPFRQLPLPVPPPQFYQVFVAERGSSTGVVHRQAVYFSALHLGCAGFPIFPLPSQTIFCKVA